MPTRLLRALCAAACGAFALFIVTPAAGAEVVADLRVLAPNATLEPGTSYVTGTEALRTDPDARCFVGGSGGSGQRVRMPGPTALGLVKSALRWNSALAPISVTDEFGFGLGVCGIGGRQGNENRFWALTVNHEDPALAGDQVRLADGDVVLWHLTRFPPGPELEIAQYPAGTTPGTFQVTVVEHSCNTEFPPVCGQAAAAGATVTGGGGAPVTTDAEGHATISAPSEGELTLQATKQGDIPSAPVGVCVDASAADCPTSPGKTIFGRDIADQFAGTPGWDVVQAGGGDDEVDLTDGGRDRINCGGGRDKVLVGAGDTDDRISPTCERVRPG